MNKILTILILVISSHGFGQIKLTGQIVDVRNNPLPNASINVVGLTASAVSDESGVFFATLPISIKKGDIITLRVSKDGYNTISKHIAATFLSIPIKLSKELHPRKKIITSNAIPTNSNSAQSKSYSEPPSQSTAVTSYFQSGGITAGQVNIAPLARHLDDATIGQLQSFMTDKNEKIVVTSVMGDSEAFQYANEISKFLKSNGYAKVDGVNQAIYSEPIQGQYINRDTLGVHILIGARK